MFNSFQLLIIGITMLIALASQTYLKSTFTKYSKIQSSSNLTGAQVAQKIMDANGITDVRLEGIEAKLGDHFDPRNKVVRLSPDVLNSNSIAAQAVAAHEIGHVLQYANKMKAIQFRNTFLPLVQISSSGMWTLIVFGLIFSMSGLIMIGIAMFLVVLAFQILTLPIEFNASKRANVQLVNLGIVSQTESAGVSKVLNAAALTYVAAVVTSILTLIRLIALSRR